MQLHTQKKNRQLALAGPLDCTAPALRELLSASNCFDQNTIISDFSHQHGGNTKSLEPRTKETSGKKSHSYKSVASEQPNQNKAPILPHK